MKKAPFFDNLKDFESPHSPLSYWSWQNFSQENSRHLMRWDMPNHSSADYLRTKAYAGNADFSVIGQSYAHTSSHGAIEWCWPSDNASRWYIDIEMYFIYSHSKTRKVVELWQDDVLLWRQGFHAEQPVAHFLTLPTTEDSREIRLIVLNETNDIDSSKFIYRLKLYQHDANMTGKNPIVLPQKHQMCMGFPHLPADLQRKLFEIHCQTDALTPDEKMRLQQAVTAKALQQLQLTDRKFGESRYYGLKK